MSMKHMNRKLFNTHLIISHCGWFVGMIALYNSEMCGRGEVTRLPRLVSVQGNVHAGHLRAQLTVHEGDSR